MWILLITIFTANSPATVEQVQFGLKSDCQKAAMQYHAVNKPSTVKNQVVYITSTCVRKG